MQSLAGLRGLAQNEQGSKNSTVIALAVYAWFIRLHFVSSVNGTFNLGEPHPVLRDVFATTLIAAVFCSGLFFVLGNRKPCG